MSLRARLVLLVLVLTTSVLGLLGVYVGASLREWTLESVDGELERRAQVLMHEVRVDDGRVEVDDDDDLSSHGLPYRVETSDGAVLLGDGLAWSVPSGPGFATIDVNGKPVRVYSVALRPEEGEPLVLRVAAPMTAVSELAARFQSGFLLALALAAVLAAAGAALIARHFLAPLERLSRDADAVEVTTVAARLNLDGLGPELRTLGLAFNGVLDRLAGALEAQRAFVARASHALRTPLASILSQAEVALLRERTPEVYRQALNDVAASTREAAGLADGLLALSRAEGPTREARQPLRLTVLEGELQRTFAVRAEAAGVRWKIQFPDVEVLVARGRLREMVEALVDNAVKYTPSGGQVDVTGRVEAGGLRVEVRDTGRGLSPDERTRVFERFFRGSAAESSGQAGSGLGLAVVKALAEAEGGKVWLEQVSGGGTCAVLQLPMLT